MEAEELGVQAEGRGPLKDVIDHLLSFSSPIRAFVWYCLGTYSTPILLMP